MNPCKDHCLLRYGKEYSEECDTTCDYAIEVKKRQKLEREIQNLEDAVNELETLKFAAGERIFKDDVLELINKIKGEIKSEDSSTT